jgi:hypothetical protein
MLKTFFGVQLLGTYVMAMTMTIPRANARENKQLIFHPIVFIPYRLAMIQLPCV